MLKTLIIVVAIGALAVEATPVEKMLAMPSNIEMLEPNHEAPLNCLASRAVTRPSIGEEMCLSVLSKDADTKQQDAVFECACALATHTIWYKNIANELVKRASRAADLTIVDRIKDHKEFPRRDSVLINGFADRVEFAMGLGEVDKQRLTRLYLSELGSMYPINVTASWSERDKQQKEQGKRLAKQTCKHLATNEKMSSLIKPSLLAIETSQYGSANLRRALTVTQAELGQLIGLSNLCEHVIDTQLD